jgi:diguanylate cyclase (GGDEF)-like protein/PAS domain S-box-containing protein
MALFAQDTVLAVLDCASDLICVVDPALRVVAMNRAMLAFLGRKREDVLGQALIDVLPSALHDAYMDRVEPALRRALGGDTDHYRARPKLDHTGERDLDVEISPLVDAQQRIVGAIYAARDLTRARAVEDHARLATMMFDHATEGVIIFDHHHRIRRVNASFLAMSGYQEKDLLGEQPDALLSPFGKAWVYQDIWNTLESQPAWHGEVVYRRADGRMLPTWQTVVAIRDANQQVEHYMAVLDDLSERHAFEQQLERLVYYDILTGLPNRALLADRLNQAIGRAEHSGERLALLFIDLARFKAINDTFGPVEGDQLLCELARRMSELLESAITLFRVGADQFAVLMPSLDSPDQAAALAHRLLDAVAVPYTIQTQTITLSVVIGVSVYPDDGVDYETLLQCAETAMKSAKRSGHQTFRFFTHDMNQRSAEFLLLDNQMRQGLRRGEFRLHYQPQIDLSSGGVVGFEALLRWQHPELGIVPPNRFIPVAEESGLIVEIGEWVLREACRQNRLWQAEGLCSVPVAVNVSARQFTEGLDRTVADALDAVGLSPALLELEVTESTLMQDANAASLILSRLKVMGLRLSIDDFGTGYSSLSYLKRFPLDKLKVDRSFVTDILTDPDDAAIAAAVVNLAKNLRLKVIAEGVESEAQRQFLRGIGCQEIQGWLIAPALPAEEVPTFLADYANQAHPS